MTATQTDLLTEAGMPRIIKPAAVRREEILDCALDLFARQGYDATSVNQLIECAGISKGAFYHHFSSKEDVLETRPKARATSCPMKRSTLSPVSTAS